MSLSVDIVVFDKLDQILALVQVRGARNTSVEWARNIREAALTAQPKLMSPPYFLVVARDWVYLWDTRDRDCPPQFRYATPEMFAGYFNASGTNPGEIAPSALELIVGIWLTEMAAGSPRSRDLDHGLSALLEAIADGHIKFPTAA